ncbi:MAG: hypothetical protein HUJ28_09855 [Chromatiales bacterium]|nr:hypothetical protein [Chromatiales bacterium]
MTTAHSLPDAPRTHEPRPTPVGVHQLGFGFLPAFRDIATGETHLSINSDGSLAPVHLLDGIPDHWVLQRDQQARVVALRETVIAGYLRGASFYTHRELQDFLPDA